MNGAAGHRRHPDAAPLPDAEAGVSELTHDECHRLLAGQGIGRLAFVVRGQPIILPVNYIYAEGRVVFRTGEGLKLRHAPRRRVAFEIDGLDESGQVGWSVLVQGTAFDITDAADSLAERLRGLPLVPFGAEDKPHWVEIVPLEITGRRVKRARKGNDSSFH